MRSKGSVIRAHWLVGSKIPINVYDENGSPVCQCQTQAQAARIVRAVNDEDVLIHLLDGAQLTREQVREEMARMKKFEAEHPE